MLSDPSYVCSAQPSPLPSLASGRDLRGGDQWEADLTTHYRCHLVTITVEKKKSTPVQTSEIYGGIFHRSFSEVEDHGKQVIVLQLIN